MAELRTVDSFQALEARISLTKKKRKEANIEHLKALAELRVHQSRKVVLILVGAVGVAFLSVLLLVIVYGLFDDFHPFNLAIGLTTALGKGLFVLIIRRAWHRHCSKDDELRDRLESATLMVDELENAILRFQKEQEDFMLEHEEAIKKGRAGLAKDDEKECPACAEKVKSRARICRYCRYEF